MRGAPPLAKLRLALHPPPQRRHCRRAALVWRPLDRLCNTLAMGLRGTFVPEAHFHVPERRALPHPLVLAPRFVRVSMADLEYRDVPRTTRGRLGGDVQ